jgi:branched-chain amino acid transport system substrate-binding protein
MVQPMSGSLAAYATEGQPAFDYVIKTINEGGGIHSMGGAQIEVVLADDTSQPSVSATEARRLVSESGCVMLVGSILSAQMLAMTPVVDELKIPTLSIWAGGVKSPYMFSLGFPYDKGYAETLSSFIQFLSKQKGFDIKTIAMAYSNYEAGQQVNAALKPKLLAAGYKIVGEAPLDTRAQDQSSAMILLRSMRADVVTGLVTPRDGLLLHQARYNLNAYGSLYIGGTGGYSDNSLWKDLGPDVGVKVLTRNLFGMTGFSAGARLQSIQDIVTELQAAKLPVQIGQSAIQAAQAARLLQRVLEGAKSTDPADLLASLAAVEIRNGDHDLYLARPGGLKFGPDRMLTDSSALMIQWEPDKSQQVVFPADFAQTDPRPRS